jgi:RNA polymerase sigma-70 factor (ECF subfamily)
MSRFPIENSSLLSEAVEVETALRLETNEAASGLSLLDRLTLRFKTDEDLVARLRDGQADAMTVLFERHSALVYGIVQRVVRESAESEDVVQQVFLDVFRSIHQYDARRGTAKSWLLMFAYQRALNRKRDLKARRFYASDSLDEALPQLLAGAGQSLPFRLSQAEGARLVEEGLSMIQPRQRRVIELVYYGGLTSEEAAKVTGESVRVVRHNLYRGLEKMRSVLHDAETPRACHAVKSSNH